MQKLRTVVVGMGARGKIHLHGILQNSEMFEVVGICDQKKERPGTGSGSVRTLR